MRWFSVIAAEIEKAKTMRWLGTMAVVLVVAIIAIVLLVVGGEIPENPQSPRPIGPREIGSDIIALIVLLGVGAFGGYLSALKNDSPTLVSPEQYTKYLRRAVLQGAAGALIIFTLAPIDPQIIAGLFVAASGHQHPHVFIKLIALALVGGYAGGALLESSASQFAQKIENLAKSNESIKDEQKLIKEDQKSIKAEQTKTAYVLNLVEQVLHGLEVDIKAFNEAVKGTSSVARSEIFSRADDNRRENWKSNQEHMERSLPLLYALTATDEVEICHWWYGALAYCLKDKRNPDYEMALRYLTKAIAVRGDNVRSGAYEFNRAICRINLVAMNPTKEWDTEIRRDIDAARRFPKFAGIINGNRTIQDWLQKTEAQPAALKVNFGQGGS